MPDFSLLPGQLKSYLWSGPLLWLLVFTGLFLTWHLKGLQFRYLGHSLKLILNIKSNKTEKKIGDLSSFAALMTALAGAIGTGNISGIAIAVSIGGLGSLFWMWVIALIGMVTAYSEALLAIKYRTINSNGQMSGGPMFTLVRGLGFNKLAIAFSVFGIIASFGIGGTVQSNSVAAGLNEAFAISPLATGVWMAILTGAVVIGGISFIGRVASIMVPFMALFYIAGGMVVCFYHWQNLPQAFIEIIQSAFTGQAAAGAFAGTSAWLALEQGVANGIFANEAGLGSLAIAAASANTQSPAKQGMFAIGGVFIATMLVCTITGLVLAVSGVIGQTSEVNGLPLTGSALTMAAFNTVSENFGILVVLGLIFFAFTTILAWAYYGEKCLEFLVGERIAFAYRFTYVGSVVLGAIIKPQLVWDMANLANGLMAIPNLIAIIGLTSVIKAETQNYLAKLEKDKVKQQRSLVEATSKD